MKMLKAFCSAISLIILPIETTGDAEPEADALDTLNINFNLNDDYSQDYKEEEIAVGGATFAGQEAAECGQEGPTKYRISGGDYTAPHQYPWMVYFASSESGSSGNSDKSAVCGGSLISDRLVLTAKHCVKYVLDGGAWKFAKAGVNDIDDPQSFVNIEFGEILLPEDPDERNDMALVVLKEPVNLKDPKIGVVCLPETDGETYVGEKTIAMGWGYTRFDGKGGAYDDPHVLKSVDLQVAERTDKYQLYTKLVKKDGVYQDPCAGDSGGPLISKKNGRSVVIAVVEGQGYDCNKGTVHEIRLGVWTKLGPNLKWIKTQIRKYSNSG